MRRIMCRGFWDNYTLISITTLCCFSPLCVAALPLQTDSQSIQNGDKSLGKDLLTPEDSAVSDLSPKTDSSSKTETPVKTDASSKTDARPSTPGSSSSSPQPKKGRLSCLEPCLWQRGQRVSLSLATEGTFMSLHWRCKWKGQRETGMMYSKVAVLWTVYRKMYFIQDDLLVLQALVLVVLEYLSSS